MTTVPPTRGNPNVQKERTPVPSIVLTKNDERKRFAAILSATDVFLSQVVLAIEDVVDPHNERALQQFFAKMAKDNVVKNNLPKFAAGTGFSKTLNALNVLSVAATNACVPEMAKATHNMHRSRTSVHPTATRTSVQPTSSPRPPPPAPSPRPRLKMPIAHESVPARIFMGAD